MAEPEFMKSVVAVLKKAGYRDHQDHPIHGMVEELSHNGPFVVHGAWISKDGHQWVHVEQNTAPPPDDIFNADGTRIVQAAQTYPPILVIENDRGGRVAVSVDDLQAFAGALSGEGPHNFTDAETYVEGPR